MFSKKRWETCYKSQSVFAGNLATCKLHLFGFLGCRFAGIRNGKGQWDHQIHSPRWIDQISGKQCIVMISKSERCMVSSRLLLSCWLLHKECFCSCPSVFLPRTMICWVLWHQSVQKHRHFDVFQKLHTMLSTCQMILLALVTIQPRPSILSLLQVLVCFRKNLFFWRAESWNTRTDAFGYDEALNMEHFQTWW